MKDLIYLLNERGSDKYKIGILKFYIFYSKNFNFNSNFSILFNNPIFFIINNKYFIKNNVQ